MPLVVLLRFPEFADFFDQSFGVGTIPEFANLFDQSLGVGTIAHRREGPCSVAETLTGQGLLVCELLGRSSLGIR